MWHQIKLEEAEHARPLIMIAVNHGDPAMVFDGGFDLGKIVNMMLAAPTAEAFLTKCFHVVTIVVTIHHDFERDETKRRNNLQKHGVDFIDAVKIFARPVLEKPDQRKY